MNNIQINKKIKIYSLLLVVVILTFSATSCNTYTSEECFRVLEEGGYDGGNLPGAKHTYDIVFSGETSEDFKLFKKKTVEINGVKYIVEYKHTEYGYLYDSIIDVYDAADNLGQSVTVKINKKNNRVVYYNVEVRKNSSISHDVVQYDRNECLDIAYEYISTQTDDADKYQITSESDYNGCYFFHFSRYIEDTETSDRCSVTVNAFDGRIIGFSFISWESMKDALFPAAEDMKTIESNIQTKLNEIYGCLLDTYDVEYEIDDKSLLRLVDGDYVLRYQYNVKATQKSDMSIQYYDTCVLLIYC